MDWFTRFFSTSGFEPYGYCLLWNGQLISLYVISDALIGASYFAISGTLIYLAYRGRRTLPFSPVMLAFGIVILACGATYFMDVMTLWYPAHWLAASVNAATAVASVATAVMLPLWIPRALSMMRAADAAAVTTAALRESAEGFRNSTRYSAIGHALVGLDGQFVEVNQALARIVGLTPEQLTGMTFQSITYPDDLDADLTLLRQLAAGEIDSYEMEKRYVHSSGRVVSAQLNVSVVRDVEGRPVYFISQVQDLTERRSLEQQLRQSHKLEAVGRLAGGVAHDFNNILAAILAFTDCALDELPDTSSARADLEEIRAAATRGSRLTKQLLTFGRRHLRRPSAVDLGAVLRESEALLRQLVGAHIEIFIDAGEGPATVHSDPSELDQLLLNLVVNARDAMPSGGTLHVAVQRVVLLGSGVPVDLPRGSYACLSVTDSGAGIAEDVLPHIFEPFFTTKGDAGSGLGLSTVYGIARQNGGDVTVTSRPGEGTAFFVYMPLHSSDELLAPAAASLDDAPTVTGTVLFVEDEAALRHVCERVLVKAGHTVIAARHGGDAMRLWTENRDAVDILITDLVMPEMGGRELAANLHLSCPDLPVIFMSGYTDDEISRRALHDPNVAFLAKPFEPAELLRTVSDILARERLRANVRESL
jgi:two-component system, cell cycle sensor histidine kinase and response regulator CckA